MRRPWEAAEVAACLSNADTMEDLGGGGGRGADNVELRAGPVGGHLATTAGGISFCTDGLEEHFFRSDTEGDAEAAVAIVGDKPVVAGAEREGGSDLESFMACAGDLEEDFLLALEHDFAVVDAARGEHQAVNVDELRGGEGLRAPGAEAFSNGCGRGDAQFCLLGCGCQLAHDCKPSREPVWGSRSGHSHATAQTKTIVPTLP